MKNVLHPEKRFVHEEKVFYLMVAFPFVVFNDSLHEKLGRLFDVRIFFRRDRKPTGEAAIFGQFLKSVTRLLSERCDEMRFESQSDQLIISE